MKMHFFIVFALIAMFEKMVKEGFMKKIILLCLLLTSMNLFAEEREKVALELPADFDVKICPQPLWHHVKVVWKGVEDARINKDVGVQTKAKGEDPVYVEADPSLKSVLEPALKQLLTRCGLEFVVNQSGNVLYAQIEHFYADVKKGFFTGKGKAESQINFVLVNGDMGMTTYGMSAGIDLKKMKRKDIKQLEMLLNELLFQTLEQIPKSDLVKEIK